MKTPKIQYTEVEAEIEAADIDDFVPMTCDELLKDPDKLVDILDDDLGHFLALSLQDKTRVYKTLKRLVPQPEFKYQHEWLLEALKDDIDDDKRALVVEGIRSSTDLEGSTPPPVVEEKFRSKCGRGAKKEIDYAEVEDLAFKLDTKTAVAQALGFYGAPGFNNRLKSDAEFKAAYDRGIARRQAK